MIYRKTGAHREFLIVDAAMNDLIRPSLYDAWHTILPVTEEDQDAPRTRIDVVGPVCESVIPLRFSGSCHIWTKMIWWHSCRRAHTAL